MRAAAAVVSAAAALALLAGCSVATRHATLSFFFDGVPEPGAEQQPAAQPQVAPGAARAGAGSAHQPYAEKQCGACHDAAKTNAVAAEGETLCLGCHEIKLDLPHVHTAITAGGCTGCHDPHASGFPRLLPAAGDDVCFTCHDRKALDGSEMHRDREANCTTCHDPHASDQPNLLK